MKRLLVAAALLTTACGTTVPLTATAPGVDPGASSWAPTPSSAAAPRSPGAQGISAQSSSSAAAPTEVATPGVVALGTAVRTPLRVGITYAEAAATAVALGASSDPVDGKSTAAALVRALNSRGGLSGRRLVPVTFGWDTTSGSYANDAASACELFTRDSRVDVVLDPVFGQAGGFGSCLQAAGVLHLTTGAEGDRSASRGRALHANPLMMVDDRTYGAVVSNLYATRYLTRENQVGVLLEQCPTDEAAFRRTVLPLMRQLGLKEPVVRRLSCTTGFSSAGAAAAAVSSTVLAFRDAGVDRVLMMSDYETVALLLFANAASSQGYRPGYLLSSTAQAEATRTSIPSDQWPQLHGVGINTADVAGAPPSVVEKRCLALARAGGLTVATQNDRTYVYMGCSLFLLLGAGLERTDGVSRPAQLASAISGLGASFVAPGIVSGATDFHRRYDGPAAVRVFGWVGSCSCLRHLTPPRPAPRS